MAPRGTRKVRQLADAPLRPGDPGLRPKGKLLVIGGHEDKDGDALVLRALARHVGGGKLVIAPLASESPDEIWDEYETVMRRLGVRHVYRLRIEERRDGSSARVMRVLEGATAVFFTGGDQTRITSTIGDTPAYSRILELFVNGATIAGTSAGASVLTETMMVGGDDDKSARVFGAVRLAPGLGFARDIIIDQHFAERGRIGRLLSVVAQNPRVLGIGIDENTAIELDPVTGFHVLGQGAVTIVDGSSVTATNVSEEQTDRAVSIFGVTLHVLSQSDRFDLTTRTPTLRSAETVDRDLGIKEHGEAAD